MTVIKKKQKLKKRKKRLMNFIVNKNLLLTKLINLKMIKLSKEVNQQFIKNKVQILQK